MNNINKDYDNDELQIIDEENYTPEQQQQFSHQVLVMKVMNKCLEAGCKEMRMGYYNSRQDKMGNTIKTYTEDTRKAFIECVETLEMIMICDLDTDASDNIKEIKKKLDEIFKKLISDEEKDWNKSSGNIKRLRWTDGIFFRKDYLNIKLPYYQDYIEEQVKSARMVFKELTLLTKRLDFYENIGLEA